MLLTCQRLTSAAKKIANIPPDCTTHPLQRSAQECFQKTVISATKPVNADAFDLPTSNVGCEEKRKYSTRLYNASTTEERTRMLSNDCNTQVWMRWRCRNASGERRMTAARLLDVAPSSQKLKHY